MSLLRNQKRQCFLFGIYKLFYGQTMQSLTYKNLVEAQQKFFATRETYSYVFRIEQLKKLKSLIEKYEKSIATALYQDLRKPYSEAVFIEVSLVIDEINFIITNLKKWMRPRKVKSPFPLLWPGKSSITYNPYGSVLIISPWNFPFLLCFSPLIGAICAGNCAVIKPSEHAPHTKAIILDLMKTNFPAHYIAAVQGEAAEVQDLLKEKFNYIFFTGSPQIGREIMSAAAKELIPVTLELGGKSPCIVDDTADLAFAARRIIWAKMMNAGQVCLAPDYVYVHDTCKNLLIQNMLSTLKAFYGDDAKQSKDFARIINEKHFRRLKKLLAEGRIITGGQNDEAERYIAPTLLDEITMDSHLMQEEIFGPLLPIITYSSINEVVHAINAHSAPLALYLFSNNKVIIDKVMNETKFGGGCVNDCTLHSVNPYLPFGGVGGSGMGRYHGKSSFETFSYQKSCYHKKRLFDFKLEYPPHTTTKLWWLKKLMRL